MRTYLFTNILLSILICLISCDNQNQSEAPKTEKTGTMRLSTQWPADAETSDGISRTAVNCTAAGINTITVEVIDSTGKVVAQGGPWRCAVKSGKIDEVPPGENYRVALYAHNNDGAERYRGQQAGVSIQAGATTDVAITVDPVFTGSISMVEDLMPGAESSFPQDIVSLNDRLLLVARDADVGFGLFALETAADSEPQLTRLYPKNNMIDADGTKAPCEFAELNGWLYFRADDGKGFRIWRTNGTAEQTVPIDTNPEYANPTELTPLNNILFFVAENGSAGRELWAYNTPTRQSQMVFDINPGPTGSNPQSLTAVGDDLFYSADDGTHGVEIWRTVGDITNHNSALTEDIYLGSDAETGPASSYPSELTEVNGRLFFYANQGKQDLNADPPKKGAEVWMMWATNSGIQAEITEDLVTTTVHSSGSCRGTNLTNIDGRTLAYSARTEEEGQEPYLYNFLEPNAKPQRIIPSVNPGEASAFPANFVQMNNVLYFTANNVTSIEHLWAYNLSTHLLNCLTAAIQDQNPSPRHLTVIKKTLYFSVMDQSGRRRLWATDGNHTGLVVEAKIGHDQIYSPSNLIALSGQLYFSAFNEDYGEEVYKLVIDTNQ